MGFEERKIIEAVKISAIVKELREVRKRKEWVEHNLLKVNEAIILYETIIVDEYQHKIVKLHRL